SALSPGTPLPTLSPKIAGSWEVSGATATFTPAAGYLPDTKVTLTIPAGMAGAATSAGTLKKPSTVKVTTGSYSALGLQLIPPALGYLPLTWPPAASGRAGSIPSDAPAAGGSGAAGSALGSLNEVVSTAYAPPAGTFTFKPGYPSQLTSQWKTGKDNMLD